MIRFDVELKSLGLFLVGGPTPIHTHLDITVHRTRDPDKNVYVPTIPGSSVKGVLRSSLSRVAHAFGIKVCGDWPQASDDCDSCYLFGAPGSEGRVWVSDFTGERSTVSLTHVSLDDSAGTAREMALYTSEYVKPGSIFKGRIEYNGGVERLAPLLVAMAALRTDRAGRSGLIDLRIANADQLRGVLSGLGEYSILLEYLGVWAWDEGV
ncbi:MAG: RAMP superfamily CRISPR-associated protein [Nitrososphaerota archaeon]